MSSEKELIDGKGGFQFCSLAGEKGWKMFQQKKKLENKTTSLNKETV